jgi:hypothetical protein
VIFGQLVVMRIGSVLVSPQICWMISFEREHLPTREGRGLFNCTSIMILNKRNLLQRVFSFWRLLHLRVTQTWPSSMMSIFKVVHLLYLLHRAYFWRRSLAFVSHNYYTSKQYDISTSSLPWLSTPEQILR